MARIFLGVLDCIFVKKIKPVALSIVELCLAEEISQLIEKNFGGVGFTMLGCA